MKLRIAASLLLAMQFVGATMAQTHRQDVIENLPAGTVMVLWLDISKVDVKETMAFMNEQGGGRPSPQQIQQVTAMKDALVQLGVQRIYYATDLTGLPEMKGKVIIPSSNPQATQLLLASIGAGLGTTEPLDFSVSGELTIGTRKGAKSKSGAPESELLAALNANTSAHGMVFATPPQVSMTLLGILKSSVVGEDVSEMAKLATVLAELRSLSVSTEMPPSSFVLSINNKSEAAATRLSAYLNEQIAKKIPKLASDLTWTTAGEATKLVSNSSADTAKKLTATKKLFAIRSGVTANSMKQIALAMHNYAAANGHLPPQCIVDKKGNRLLSWRVLILPYLEQNNLYNQFRLDEPWDSEHNLKLASTVPFPYTTADGLSREINGVTVPLTQMVAPMTKDSSFGRSGPPMRFRNFLDGTSNTIWFVETSADKAVPWTKPADLPVSTETPFSSIAGDSDGFHFSRVDGSVGYLTNETEDATINALLTVDGGEVVPPESVK